MKLLSNIIGFVLIVSTFTSSSVVEINPTESVMNTCQADDDVCTLNYSMELKPWIHELYMRTVTNRRSAEEHPFIAAISAGGIPRTALLKYFEGMYWHGKSV